jgi:DNA-binding response OmpR family regulator
MNIPIIDDDVNLAKFIHQRLKVTKYQIAHDGKTGIGVAFDKFFYIILIDVNMPELNRFDLCAKLRENNISMDFTTSKVVGLDSGADNYLAKLFELQELLSRIGRWQGDTASPPKPTETY